MMQTIPVPRLLVPEIQPMPIRLSKFLLLYLSPSDIPSAPVLAVQLAVSVSLAWVTAGLGFIGGLPVSMQVFVWAMLAASLSGLYACGKNEGGFWQSFSWRVGIEGIFRKAIISVIALIGWKICGLVGPSAELVAAGLTYLCALNEGASIIANLRRGRFEVPGLADQLLMRARRQFETANPDATKVPTPPDPPMT